MEKAKGKTAAVSPKDREGWPRPLTFGEGEGFTVTWSEWPVPDVPRRADGRGFMRPGGVASGEARRRAAGTPRRAGVGDCKIITQISQPVVSASKPLEGIGGLVTVKDCSTRFVRGT